MSELYIGLMSGTSMDAIDAALVDLSQGIALRSTHSIALPEALRARLQSMCASGADEIEVMGRLDVELGQLFAKAALGAIKNAGLAATDIRAIGSHGQTIRHRPQAVPAFTLQITDPNTIAEQTGITVVADFRRRDMAAGGQGAPLVPAFHAHLFSHAEHHRIVLNLGGIANITVLTAGAAGTTFGFDTGPANLLMDAWCLQHQGKAFDAEGQWAASGIVHEQLLSRLLDHPHFQLAIPKSTGREDFHMPWLRSVIDGLGQDIAPVNVQATLLELTARSVAQAIAATGLPGGELLVCGGGAFNRQLWQRLSALLPDWRLASTADFGLAPTWVEACAFAWLAQQTLKGLPGNLPAVTGAKGPRILGGIYPA